MEEVYLWEDLIPRGLQASKEANSETFFKKFIYDEEDHWSFISDDYYETSNLFSGVTTTGGYEFILMIYGANQVMGVLEYVLPESPAALAGLKRGDIFIQVDGVTLDYDNYYKILTSGNISYSLGIGKRIDQHVSFDYSVNITEVEEFQENPIFLDTVYTIDNKKIGYLIYNSFLAEYNTQKSEVFAAFKSEGITDLIIDLRYNGGGSGAAKEHLANMIAPQSAIGDIFSKEHYNALYNDYFESKYGADYLNTTIKSDDNNINLNGKLIGLVSSGTASASEGLLNGLKPHVDLTLIGDTTHGKYTGMWVLANQDSTWAIVPIVVKSTNKDNESVRGGMIPNIVLDDDPLDGYQLGDIEETMLAKAISEITGQTPSTRHTKQHFETKTIARFKNGQLVKPALNIAKMPPPRNLVLE